MKKSKVEMVCKEVSRVTVFLEHSDGASQEEIKDMAWAQFDENCTMELEQENFTKIRAVEGT